MYKHSLICRPIADGTPVWVPLNRCVWDGEKWFRVVTGLRHLYPDCEELFVRHLRCERLGVGHLLMELQAITPSCDVNYISVVLTLFQSLHTDGRHVISHADIRTCQSIAMFPIISQAEKTDNQNSFGRLASLEDDDWFVADKAQLKTAFAGRLPLLALDVAKISELMPLFKLLGMGNRLLGEASKRTVTIDGNAVVENRELAMLYRSRGAFIQRYVSPARTCPHLMYFVSLLTLFQLDSSRSALPHPPRGPAAERDGPFLRRHQGVLVRGELQRDSCAEPGYQPPRRTRGERKRVSAGDRGRP